MRRVKVKSLEAKNSQTLKSRINLILAIVFLLCLALILRLGYLQVIKGETYQAQIENTQYVEINHTVPRGEIYDRNGNLLVANESQQAIFFTRHRNMSSSEIYEVAVNLNDILSMDTSTNNLRDKQNYILNHYPQEVERLMPSEYRLLEDGNISLVEFNEEFYDTTNEDTIDRILTENDQNIIAINSVMQSSRELHPIVIKNENVTDEEFAQVNAHKDTLTGISTGMDWNRTYPYGGTLRSILGEVSTQEEGLPAHLLEQYLARGYSRNDRVGKSYLEYQYEEVLSGTKEQVKYTTDKSGRIINQEIHKKGEPGNNLYLTIDIELQQELESIAEHHLSELRRSAEYVNSRITNDSEFNYSILPEYLNTVVMVVQNPNNGEILAMVGKQINDEGDIVDYAHGTFTSTYVTGSSVKGATVALGYQEDIITPGAVQVDEPLNFADGTIRSSFFNRYNSEPITDVQALMVSSNVYMYKIALNLAGTSYEHNMNYPTSIEGPAQTLRNGFKEFGLGVSTGLDLPNEATGLSPNLVQNPGNYLDFVIGQYDTYSAMQLSQYISTIASGGNRMQLHLAKEVRENNPNDDDRVIQSYNGMVLNTINNTDEELTTIKDGFYHVFNTHDTSNNWYGTGYDAYHELNITSAGKTGTAETVYDGHDFLNQTYVGYTPYNNPEMAFSIIFPNMPYTIPFFPSQFMGRDVINKYHELYNEEPEVPLYQFDVDEIYQTIRYGN